MDVKLTTACAPLGAKRARSRPQCVWTVCLLGALLLPGQSLGTTPPDTENEPGFEVRRWPDARLPGGPITFSAIGDAPYSEAEFPAFLQQLEDHRRYSRAQFMVHVGDIKGGSEPCVEERYALTAAWLRAMDVPVYIVPGDNEWVDCADPTLAWTYWTTHLMRLEQHFCATPPIEYQDVRPENFAFVKSGVLFVGINVVAGSPDDAMVESADWVHVQLVAKKGKVRAAVVFSQAGPSASRRLFFDRFVADVTAFADPVLLVHGDGHSWMYDSPYLAPNLTRAQLDRTLSPPAHFTVTRDPAQPFVYERDPWPPGTPRANNVPCVDAGADQLFAVTGPAYLRGRGTDDGLLTPLALTWSQESGPGAATFGDASSASTTVQCDVQGTYVLRLEANDGLYVQDDTVTLVAADPATVPQAFDDFYAGDEDAPLAVLAPGVLGNDVHGLGPSMTAALFESPAHGTLVLAANGGFTYQPAPNWFGTDTFLYAVTDPNGGIDVGTVTLQMHPVNDVPVAVGEAYSVEVGQTLQVAAPGVLANDSDADGDPLTLTLSGSVAHGTLVLQPDGGFTYTPRVDYIGTDSFVYRIDDGLTPAVAAATIAVGPVVRTTTPQADAYVRSSNATTNYGSATRLFVEQDRTIYHTYLRFTVSGVGASVRRALLRLYANDGGPEAGQVHLVANTYQGSTTAWTESGITWSNAPLIVGAPIASVGTVGNATWVEWDVTAAIPGDGTYSFGIQSFSTNVVEYSSKEGARPPQLVIETDLPNEPPVANDDAYTGSEDQVLVVPGPGVLANDSDDPRDILTVTLLTGPAAGTLDLQPDGGFTYAPPPDFHGHVGFTYRVQDTRGGVDSGSVALALAPVNDAPVARDDAYTSIEDDTLTVAPPGVLGNDSDVDGAVLTAALVVPPGQGVLVLGSDGGFSYVPSPNFHGTATCAYLVQDGAGGSSTSTVTLTVTAVNDVPVAIADSFSVDAEGRLEIGAPGVLGNDSDADGDTLVAAVLAEPAHGGLVLQPTGGFAYTPAPGFGGTDSFTYGASDGHGGAAAATVTLTVASVNDAPVAADDSYGTDADVPLQVATPGVLGNDGDPDGDVLTATVATGPANGTLDLQADGGFTYTPAADFNGSDAFTYSVSDGHGGACTAAVTILVHADSLASDSTLAVATAAAKPQIALGPAGVRVYPNPFNGRTTVAYDVEATGAVEVAVYNVRGQRVRLLVQAVQAPGRHEVVWEGRDAAGVAVETGVYFVRLRLGARTRVARLLLLQ